MNIKIAVGLFVAFFATNLFAADYPIVFLAAPKVAGAFRTSDTDAPYSIPAADLMLLKIDGTEEILVAKDSIPGGSAITDPLVSLDGLSVYYAHVFGSPKQCDLYRIDLATRAKTKLTDAPNEWRPLRAVQPLYTAAAGQPGNQQTQVWTAEGVFNMAPCETAGGVVFVSNRDALQPVKDQWTNLQLYRMDKDGKNVERIGPMNLGGALHPTLRQDGAIEFSSGEMQGTRASGGGGNGWSIWEIWPDGSHWGPVVSNIDAASVVLDPYHFQTRTSDGSLIVQRYYSPRTNGTFYRVPPFVSGPFSPPTIFESSVENANPPIGQGSGFRTTPPTTPVTETFFKAPWQPRAMTNLTKWATFKDADAYVLGTTTLGGAVQHPAATPGNGIAFTWTGRFPTHSTKGLFDYGIYSLPDVAQQCTSPDAFTKLVDVPERHEWMAKPVVSWAAIRGSVPPSLHYEPTDQLPDGSPYGIVGSSGVNYRETLLSPGADKQGDGLHPVAEAEFIRFLLMKPNLAFPLGKLKATRKTFPGSGDGKTNQDFNSRANERQAVLGEVPLKKYRQADGSVVLGPAGEGGQLILRSDGQADTSFRAIVPADQPWTFQMLDRDKKALTTAQTWHQVRPREVRTDCGGCHAHHAPDPLPFTATFAATNEYVSAKLKTAAPVVEMDTSVTPILASHGLADSWANLQTNQRVTMYDAKNSPLIADLVSHGATPAEAATVATWIDTGLLQRFASTQTPAAAAGPWADTNAPTLTVYYDDGNIVIGAADPDSGVNVESLSVKASWSVSGRAAGDELADLFARDDASETWSLDGCGSMVGELTVEVRDRQGAAGNLTRVVKTIH